MEVDTNFSHKHSIYLLLEQVPLTTTPVFLMQEFPQPVTDQVITLTKTSNSNLSFAFCFDWTLLKNVYQKWRHKYNPVLLKTPSYWEQSCFLQIIYLLNGKKKVKKFSELVLNVTKFISMSFLTQNFDLRKLANFPFTLGMVGRRKLSGPSLNHTFNALSIGVQHTLSFQWPDFGLKCLFKNMFVVSMIFFVAIFIDLEDVALLLMSLYYWHEIDVVITCLDPF